MSSIDWQRLVQEHDRAPERDDEEWLEALMAMDEDPAERRLAEQADPLMMFRRLPAPEVNSTDVEAMKASVKNMLQVSETLAENSHQPRSKRLARWALPLAALLALAISAALLTGGGVIDAHSVDSAADSMVDTSVDSAAGSVAEPADMMAAVVADREITTSGTLPTRFMSATGKYRRASDLEMATVQLASMQIDAAASLAAFQLPLIEDADPDSDLLMQIENDEMSLVVVLTPGQDV